MIDGVKVGQSQFPSKTQGDAYGTASLLTKILCARRQPGHQKLTARPRKRSLAPGAAITQTP